MLDVYLIAQSVFLIMTVQWTHLLTPSIFPTFHLFDLVDGTLLTVGI